jgi:aromatic-amino-acid transaminase
MFEKLNPQPADPLLSLIKLFNADPRTDKIDLGVGVYRDEDGTTPVFGAIKAAEARLLAEQDSKAYLGPEGDTGFVAAIAELAFAGAVPPARVAGLQTPGGTGALRLALELAVCDAPRATVWMGTPSWPVHQTMLKALAADVRTYSWFTSARQAPEPEQLLASARAARAGDVFLVHGCCHNPTGADLDANLWRELAAILAVQGVVPLIDLAYHGLGQGLDADAAGMRALVSAVPEALVAYSCDKNFGVYRERTGAVFAVARDADSAAIVHSNLATIARNLWSMPPDHGAAAVRTILTDPGLRAQWQAELAAMQRRLSSVRTALASFGRVGSIDLAPVAGQHGMFSMLPLTPAAIAALRERHGVYMAGSGRINVAGLALADCERFVAALADVGQL